MDALGIDWSCQTDLDPFGRLSKGMACVRDAGVRRLTSRLGSLLGDPLYGFDTQTLLSEGGTATSLASVATGRIRNQLLRDERIYQVTTQRSTFDQSTSTLQIALRVSTQEGPFTLVLNLSPSGVELITSEG